MTIKNILSKTLFISLVLSYAVIGVFTITFAYTSLFDADPHLLCGVFILITSFIHVILYFYQKGYKSLDKGFLLIIGLIGIALGIVFIVNKDITLENMCFYWGILDIVRGALEIAHIVPQVKNNKLYIVEIVLSSGDIVLGILLCIHLSQGLQVHLTYLGIAFLVSAFNQIVNLIIRKKKRSN